MTPTCRAPSLVDSSPGEELITAIQEVLQGRTYLTPLIAKDVITSVEEPAVYTTITRQVLKTPATTRTVEIRLSTPRSRNACSRGLVSNGSLRHSH